ncbi:MAG: hypothetical protein WC864_09580, partial [Ilumatobacteraceae bacterium]
TRQAAQHLTGNIMQVPPMVSAIQIGGKRLHQLAREGIEVERKPRPVTIYSFDVDSTDVPQIFRVSVRCSAGTYVRTLAADLGKLLGGGAHLRNLRRVAVGAFDISLAHPPSEIELLPAATAVGNLTHINVDNEISAMVRHGRVLDAWSGVPPWAVFDEHGSLLAVYEPFEEGRAKPVVVLAEPLA